MNSANEKIQRAVLPVLALVAFWLPTLGPLIQPGRMTCSDDGVPHLLRAVQLDALVRQGILWPRWSPGMAYGYGYPLFSFYPILSLYPVLILHHVGLSLLMSWNVTMALSLHASGLGMYLWARQALGQRAGFVAAVAYMLAPYQLYNVYWRGTTAESLALPMLPVVMWAALCVAQKRRWRYALLGALAYAAILLTHAATSLVFTPVLLAYMLALTWSARNRRPPRETSAVAFQLGGVIILGLGLAAFCVVPAYLEQGQVQLWRANTPGGQDFHNHFLTPSDLPGLVQASDPLLINPTRPPASLGWAASLLAVLGIVSTWWARARLSDTHKHHVIWASLTLIGVVVMMSAISEPIWSYAPLLQSLLPLILFPWRFMGAGSLLAGLLAGAGVATLHHSIHEPSDGCGRHPRSQRVLASLWKPAIVAGLCAVMLAISVLPWAYPRLCSMPENPDLAFYAAHEEDTGLIGTATFGAFLPVDVQELPTTSPLVKSMRAGQSVIRWDAPGARAVEARDDGLSARLVLESDTPVPVVYRAFYFPGWQARLDGQPIPLTIVPPLGLMGINVPAGRHTVTIQFGNTPIRTASEIVSLIAVLAVIVIGVSDLRSALRTPRATTDAPRPAVWLGWTALGLALLALKVGVVDRYDTLLRWRRLQDGQFKGASHVSDVVVAGGARLLGYDARPQRVPAGDAVYVDLYWTLTSPLDLSAKVRLLDERGVEWSDKSELYTVLGDYAGLPPSRDWPPGMYADDRHVIQVLPGAPPGDYLLVMVPFNPATLEPLPITAGQPAPSGYPGVVVGAVQVIAPAKPPEADALNLTVRANAPMGDDLTLVGYSQDREEAAPGQAMLLTLGWQARHKPQADYALRLELLAPDGQVVIQFSVLPGGDRYPTSSWAAGEIIRSQVLARIPGRAQSGPHVWRVTLLDGGGAWVGQATLGRLQVTAPQRVLSAPIVSHPVDVRLGDSVRLVGFDAPSATQMMPGQVLSVTLVWQALGETDRDYKVFVHLLGADGRPVAQSDAVPAGWTRPTTGWQAGEFVTDTHTLDLKPDLPPGEYRLVAGMYDMVSGQRLPLASGGDAIELGMFHVSVTRK